MVRIMKLEILTFVALLLLFHDIGQNLKNYRQRLHIFRCITQLQLASYFPILLIRLLAMGYTEEIKNIFCPQGYIDQ